MKKFRKVFMYIILIIVLGAMLVPMALNIVSIMQISKINNLIDKRDKIASTMLNERKRNFLVTIDLKK